MAVTYTAHSGVALMIGSLASNRPLFMLLGSGSGTELASRSGLIAPVGSARTFTGGSADISTLATIKWRTDFTPAELSGLGINEFTLNPGSTNVEAFNYVNFGNAISFDGSNELRLELNWTVF